jgi:hypothetical protein
MALLQHVQGGTSAAATSLAAVNVAATQAGSLLVLKVGCRGATQNSVSSITGATFTNEHSTNTQSNFGNLSSWHIINAGAQVANFFTIHCAVSGSIEWELWEYSGMANTPACFYGGNTAIATSTRPSVTGSTTLQAGDVALGALFVPNGTYTFSALPGSPWNNDLTIQGTATGQSSRMQPGYTNPASGAPVAQTYVGTISNSNWAADIGYYRAAVGSGQAAVSSESFTATVTASGGGGGSGSQNPWLHGALLRQGGFPAGYQGGFGGQDVNQGAAGAVTWSSLQSALHGNIIGTGPGFTGSNQVEKDILSTRAYNTSVGADCTTPWSPTNAWQGLLLRFSAGIYSPDYVMCLGAAAGGITNLRGQWSAGATYAIDDAVLFSITVKYVGPSGTVTTWTGNAGFVSLQNGNTGHTPPTTPLTGSPATNTPSASDAWWQQVSFFEADPNTNGVDGQCPLFWTPEVGAAWFDFESKMAALYDPAAEIIEVQPTLFMTVFDERCLRQITTSWTKQNLISAGYVMGPLDGSGAVTTDIAGQINEFTMRKNLSPGWVTAIVMSAFNPYQTITPSGVSGESVSVTSLLMNSLRSLFGQQGCPANNSFRYDYIAVSTVTGFSIPGSTITVASASGFVGGPGLLAVVQGGSGATFVVYPYTSISGGNTFHGVTGIATGTGLAGSLVVGVSNSNATYQQMYAMMAALGAPLGIQTSTLAKLGPGGVTPTNQQFVATIAAAAALGASYVEFPSGFNNNPPGITAAQLAALSAAFPLQPAGGHTTTGGTIVSGAVSGEIFQSTWQGTSLAAVSDKAISTESFTAQVSQTGPSLVFGPTVVGSEMRPVQGTEL